VRNADSPRAAAYRALIENRKSKIENPLPAFTLLELITVIAIVSILAALAFPVTARVTQGAKAAACISNLNSLGVALNLYLGEHNQVMPNLQAGRSSTSGTSQNVPVIDNTLNTYATDQRVFACPADNAGLAASTGTSYYWNSVLSNRPISNLRFFNASGLNSEIPVLCDKQGFHPYAANKVNLLYADGHASQDLKFSTSSQ
jgi:prepilin-type N-terminal cleavage/methylation domain-containing protein/prepilin-type processing-associated H-X9-DG protein